MTNSLENPLPYSLYLRDEVNPFELRTPIIPSDIKKLIDFGYKIFIQSSNKRIYSDEEYINIGVIITIKPWYHADFAHSLILGLKEPDNLEKSNTHIHIYFAHSYQQQTGSEKILSLFKKTSSILYDLEYFTGINNSRLVTFGFWAGVVGCSIGILQCLNIENSLPSISNLKPWLSLENLILHIDKFINQTKTTFKFKFKSQPMEIGVIGPNGNCGKGACYVLDKLKLSYNKYTKYSDKKSIRNLNILINCIKLSQTDNEIWFDENTDFSNPIVISDISCDYTKPNNPIKIYNHGTTWENPVFVYKKNAHIISIDNLPSLLPKESSDDFSSNLLPLLKSYNTDTEKIWEKNLLLFNEKTY